MKLICNIESRVEILPHFIKYYLHLGVTKFIFGIWRGESNPNWEMIRMVLNNLNVDYIMEKSFDDIVYCGKYDSYYQNFIKDKYINADEWYILCDLDEFHDIFPYISFEELLLDLKTEPCDYIQSILVDRITYDGTIPHNINSQIDIFQQFPISCNITKNICNGWCQKVIMQLGKHTIETGHHNCCGDVKKFSKIFVTYHFKWVGDIINTLKYRYETYKELKLSWYIESYNMYQYLITHGGKIKITDDLLWKRVTN